MFCHARVFSSAFPILSPNAHSSVIFRVKIMIKTAKISATRCTHTEILLPSLIPIQSSFRYNNPLVCEGSRSSTATSYAPNNSICSGMRFEEVTTTRRRRGLIRLSQLWKSRARSQFHDGITLNEIFNNNDKMTSEKMTQYTINDSICPPTEHEVLKSIVQKHIHTLPRYWMSKPIATHTASAFEEALDFVMSFKGGTIENNQGKVKVILDSGCGTGKSSFVLGKLYPDYLILGIDQSLARLSRNKSYQPARNTSSINSVDTESNNQFEKHTSAEGNVLLIRAELTEFWKCCISSRLWQNHVHVHKHFLLYPNPYPKKARLKNRFYAHPAFPLLLMTIMMDESENTGSESEGGALIVRSNWEGYLKEFATAVGVWDELGCGFDNWKKLLVSVCAGNTVENEILDWHPENDLSYNSDSSKLAILGPNRLSQHSEPWTNFEAKYLECGEPIYEITFSKGG